MKSAATYCKRFARRFIGSTDGAFSILTAVLATVMLGFAGMAVDFGTIVYSQKKLQASTDMAALAATFDFDRSQSIVATALETNGPSAAFIEESEFGTYSDDPSVAAGSRFVGGAPGNAFRLSTGYVVPLHFMQLLTGSSTFAVSASAIAFNLPLAGLAIGTAVADADIDQVNAFMAAESGSSYNLTVAERAALDATRLSVFRVLDQLASLSGSPSESIEAVLASRVDLRTLAAGAAAALSAQASGNLSATEMTAMGALTRIAQGGGGSPAVTVSDFLTLNAHQKRTAADMISKRSDDLAVPAMSLLLGYLQMSRQDALVNQNQTVSIPGIATIAVEAVLSRSAVGGATPAITVVGPVGSSAYSSQGRVRLTISLLSPIQINLGPIHLSLTPTIPVIADVGYGTATISDISCGSDVLATTDIAVSAQSGTTRLYVGSVNNSQLTDLLTPLAPVPSQIVSTPLVSVSAESQSTIAQSGSQTLHFNWNDIDQETTKAVDSSQSLATALSDLNSSLAVTVAKAPLGTGALISTLLRTQVATVLNALQPELESILASVGLRAGYMEMRATGARCGIPALAT